MRLRTLLLAGLTLGLAAAPASAAIYTATISGTLSGVDYTQYFGSGLRMAAAPVVVEVVYDTSLGTPANGTGFVQRRGGSDYGAGLFILSSKVTVGGNSMVFQSRRQQVVTASGGSPGGFAISTDDYELLDVPGPADPMLYRHSLNLFSTGPSLIASLSQVGTHNLASLNGSVFFVNYPDPLTSYDHSYSITADFGGPATLAIIEGAPAVDGPAVPEPATWAMMLTGFALVGAAARRRAPLVAVTA